MRNISFTAFSTFLMNAGGALEMKLDSAEEAKRATGLILGQKFKELKAPTAEDFHFLTSKIKAVELKGGLLASLSAILGPSFGNVAAQLAFLDGAARSDLVGRLEVADDGRLELAVANHTNLDANGSQMMGAGIGHTGGAIGGLGLANATSGFTVEQRFPLLPATALGGILVELAQGNSNALLGAIAQSRNESKVTSSMHLNFGLDQRTELSGSSERSQVHIEVDAPIDQLVAAAAKGRGDVLKTLGALGQDAEVTVAAFPTSTKGIMMDPMFFTQTAFMGANFMALRSHAGEPTWMKTGNPGETASALARYLAGQEKPEGPAKA
jgi:hypothetical protein